uniref:RING-CH-type domain-containing protein n=1 Tax=Acrobeloides nanus TaxID=290746 RepID=A0A914BXL1_9BILA
MVHPCACFGTMGNVHNQCLNDWVNRSNKIACEICREKYATSKNVLRPVWKWSKPKPKLRSFVESLTVLLLWYSFVYIVSLIPESKFWERVWHDELSIRDDDVGRIALVMMILIVLIGVHSLIFTRVLKYINRQREIRYIDSKTYHSRISSIAASPS